MDWVILSLAIGQMKVLQNGLEALLKPINLLPNLHTSLDIW